MSSTSLCLFKIKATYAAFIQPNGTTGDYAPVVLVWLPMLIPAVIAPAVGAVPVTV